MVRYRKLRQDKKEGHGHATSQSMAVTRDDNTAVIHDTLIERSINPSEYITYQRKKGIHQHS